MADKKSKRSSVDPTVQSSICGHAAIFFYGWYSEEPSLHNPTSKLDFDSYDPVPETSILWKAQLESEHNLVRRKIPYIRRDGDWPKLHKWIFKCNIYNYHLQLSFTTLVYNSHLQLCVRADCEQSGMGAKGSYRMKLGHQILPRSTWCSKQRKTQRPPTHSRPLPGLRSCPWWPQSPIVYHLATFKKAK